MKAVGPSEAIAMRIIPLDDAGQPSGRTAYMWRRRLVPEAGEALSLRHDWATGELVWTGGRPTFATWEMRRTWHPRRLSRRGRAALRRAARRNR